MSRQILLPRRNLVSRRAVLRSALGGVLLAPFMRERQLQAQNVNPKRIILCFTPDSNPPEWWPAETGPNFTLSEPLADFAGLESELLLPRRLDHTWTYDNHHIAGIVQLFTGARFDNDTNRFADGPSIDQYLLQNTELRGGTPRASVNVAVDDGRDDHRHVISYSGSGQPIGAEVDPGRAFNNIFDGVTFGGAAPNMQELEVAGQVSTASAVDQKVTEVSMAEVRYIQRFLGQEEKQRMDLHLESLQELRMRIEQAAGGSAMPSAALVGGVCAEPDISGFRSSLTDADRITRWAEINADLIVNSFTCDITRSATYQFSFSGGHHDGLLGFRASWHDEIAHISQTDDSVSVDGESMSSRQAFIKFSRFWGSHIAHLVRRLATTAEGDGTMLDNTLVIWGVESGTNHSHDPNDMQYLLAGGRNMGFQLGQVLDVGRTSAHRLHVSVLNAFGADVTEFGSADDGSGPLPGLLG